MMMADCLVSAKGAVRFNLPVPPSANNLFVSGVSRRVKAPAYRAWLREAGWRLKLQIPPTAAMCATVAGPVRVRIEAGLARRRDLDNAIKGILDLLVRHRVIEDDSLVDDLHILRMGEAGEAEISIWPM
jgi:Holliday junction resolvase RusA-like endonuclease